VIIKICGIKNTKILSCCEKLNVDFFGLIFYEKSPRYISNEIAKNLINFSNNLKIKPVGVFVNKKIEEIINIISNLNLNYIQLHGDENQEYIDMIKKKFDLKIIKKISISNNKDINQINYYKNVDYFLFDYKPNKNELPGGNAKQFDWSLLKDIKLNKPWFLSGGVNESNINIIKNTINPDGIDLSSGVEESKGIKSEIKLKNFIYKYYEK
tara:strand:+ start:927 stop:1559 length:633 start_codon:yes stop_codon:yes gene_type:complete